MTATLRAESFPLDNTQLAALRALAFAGGVVIERDASAVLALGRAETIPLEGGLRDPETLRSVVSRLEELALPEAGGDELPLALGALPFLPDGRGEIAIPLVAVARRRDEARAVVVAPPGEAESTLRRTLSLEAPAGARTRPPDGFRLESARPHEDFLSRVRRASEEVRGGRLRKVVLVREVVIHANRPFCQEDLLERLRSLHPSCATFAVDGFIGATPELLVSRSGERFASYPLAGTAARSGDAAADREAEQTLLSSKKEREEHRAVVDTIAAALTPLAAWIEVPPSPEIVELRNVSHLRTKIEGVLARSAGRPPSVLELAGLVHPTPAVAGSPVEESLEYLTKTEELDRGRFAGPVGWVRADGDGEFHVGIRSAVVTGSRARLFAGVGIVGDSDPEAELRETQLKLQAMLAAAVRP